MEWQAFSQQYIKNKRLVDSRDSASSESYQGSSKIIDYRNKRIY
jgi:hypothetical protein